MKDQNGIKMKIKTINDFMISNEDPEILFWVGCAGSFDDRYKKVTKAFVKICFVRSLRGEHQICIVHRALLWTNFAVLCKS